MIGFLRLIALVQSLCRDRIGKCTGMFGFQRFRRAGHTAGTNTRLSSLSDAMYGSFKITEKLFLGPHFGECWGGASTRILGGDLCLLSNDTYVAGIWHSHRCSDVVLLKMRGWLRIFGHSARTHAFWPASPDESKCWKISRTNWIVQCL